MSHPYHELESTKLWEVLKEALKELIENQDIEITTNEEYVIGFLCKSIIESQNNMPEE